MQTACAPLPTPSAASGASGTITDIHRASTVDGPGLRTTVFLKGCPLRCLWCHNPETQRPGIEPALDTEKCAGCATCTRAHKQAALVLRGARSIPAGHPCARDCPVGALSFYGRKTTDDAVLAEVLKDRAYYEASGGGVTISGGEPMSQPSFALSLLRKCRSAGIHTVLDTSGFMSASLCERTLDCTDLYLFDYKVTGEALHRELTGVPSASILENLDLLLVRGAAVILRCPLIPGLNDQPEHLKAIAAFERRHPSLRGIDILTWHTMGVSKYARLGRPPDPRLPRENVPESVKDRLRAFFASRSCGKVRVL